MDIPIGDLVSSKGNITRNINPSSVPYTYGVVYETDAFYPQEIAFLRDPYILRSLRGQSLVFQPIHYTPVPGSLRIYTLIKVAVYEI